MHRAYDIRFCTRKRQPFLLMQPGAVPLEGWRQPIMMLASTGSGTAHAARSRQQAWPAGPAPIGSTSACTVPKLVRNICTPFTSRKHGFRGSLCKRCRLSRGRSQVGQRDIGNARSSLAVQAHAEVLVACPQHTLFALHGEQLSLLHPASIGPGFYGHRSLAAAIAGRVCRPCASPAASRPAASPAASTHCCHPCIPVCAARCSSWAAAAWSAALQPRRAS